MTSLSTTSNSSVRPDHRKSNSKRISAHKSVDKYHTITLPSSNLIITAVNVKIGQNVKKRDILFQVKEKSVYDAERLQQQSNLLKSDAELAKISSKPKSIKSDVVGTVFKIHLPDSLPQKAIKNAPIITIKMCPHDIIFKNLCASCGQIIDSNLPDSQNSSSSSNFSRNSDPNGLDRRQRNSQPKDNSKVLIPTLPELRVNDSLAKDISKQDKRRLHSQKKLVLLCDLDQTFIHTTEYNPNIIIDNEQIFKFPLINPGRKDPNEVMWHVTKLRPNLGKFLKNISKKFELYVATLGVRSYAKEIMKVMDPEGKYFSESRLLSRDDLITKDGELKKNQHHKANNLKHMFPCGQEMVTIIDDRVDVWGNRSNVVHVPKYYYWKNGDINDPFRKKDMLRSLNHKSGDNGGSLLKPISPNGIPEVELIDSEEEDDHENGEETPENTALPEDTTYKLDNDDYLERLEQILDEMHTRYYRSYKKQIETIEELKKSGQSMNYKSK